MTKLDARPRSLTLASVSQLQPQPVRWLIVLIPHFDIDTAAAARRVWDVASAMNSRVLFLSLYSNAAQELSLRRRLATMSAMVNDDKVFAESEIIFGNDWVEIMKSRWQADDLVMCFAEERVGLVRKPLSQVLQSELDIPLYILSGLYPQNDSHSNWLTQMAVWSGSIAIVLGFFLLQVRIDHLAKDGTQMVLQLLSIPVEVCMIWVWNSLFG